MKLQFCLGIASVLFCLIQLNTIGSAEALSVCQSNEDATNGCLKIISDPLNITSSDIFEGQAVQKVESFGTQLPTIHKEIQHIVRWELEVADVNKNNVTVTYDFPDIIRPNQAISIISGNCVETEVPSYDRDSTNKGKVIIKGAATCTFDLSALKVSGVYPGKLHMKIEEGQQN